MGLIKYDVCGVYRIVNKLNNKIYIGSSVCIKKRFIEHLSALRRNAHHSVHLQNAWNSYGEENFEFEILEVLEDYDNILVEREQYWIDYYRSYDTSFGYNISHYAGRRSGYKTSDETKEKLRQAAIGRIVSAETKERLSKMRQGEQNVFYGKHHTEETKRILSEKAKQRDPASFNISGFAKGRGTLCYTEDTYRKLRECNRGEKSGTAKLTEPDVIDILRMIQNNIPYSEIKLKYPIVDSQISRIKHKKRWGYLYDKYPELYDFD